MKKKKYTVEQYSLVCDLLHQAICERQQEPFVRPDDMMMTGEVERAFATAILEDVLGMASDLECIDCGKEPELYMVKNEVWASAGLQEFDGWVCLTCLSRRLDRPLAPSDFIDGLPANDFLKS